MLRKVRANFASSHCTCGEEDQRLLWCGSKPVVIPGHAKPPARRFVRTDPVLCWRALGTYRLTVHSAPQQKKSFQPTLETQFIIPTSVPPISAVPRSYLLRCPKLVAVPSHPSESPTT